MSRCFPYPPPGYSLSRASNEALIESIKLQKEREKSNEQRKKEKRREKKEKKKDKKEKRKEKKETTNQNSSKSHKIDNALVGENIWADSRGGLLQKRKNAETEQLERSNLTEEHEQPVCSRVPSSSSDSTENSNKRKRHNPSTDGSQNCLGNIIKIRFTKKSEPSASSDKPQLCSTSGRPDASTQVKDKTAFRANQGKSFPTSQGNFNAVEGFPTRTGQKLVFSSSTQTQAAAQGQPRISGANVDETALRASQGKGFPISQQNLITVQELPTRTGQKLVFSASKQTQPAAEGKLRTSEANAVLTPMQKLELQYNNLFDNWVPPELHTVANIPDDDDWLFQSKCKDACAEKRSRTSSNATSCSVSSLALWPPQSRHLPDADIYALPFVIPY